jgi:hypothetical protein
MNKKLKGRSEMDSSTQPCCTPMPLDMPIKLLAGQALGDWTDEHIIELCDDLVEWVCEAEKPMLARWLRDRRVAPSLVERWLAEGREARALRVNGSPKKKFLETWEWARVACSTAMAEGALYRKLDAVMACKLLPVESESMAAWEREKLALRAQPTGPQQLELTLSPGRELTQQRIEVGGPVYGVV